MTVRVIHGDMREELPKLQPVHSIVTDPPYHLTNNTGTRSPYPGQYTPIGRPTQPKGGFMGKQWDGGDIAFQPATWRLCFDLLPPGGHLLAFAGTRTYHRMAVAIEEAGFEMRDTIAWLYGSGFPKSHNVSKGIDKAGGIGVEKFKKTLAAAVQQSGLSRKRIDELCGFTMRFDTPYEADTVGWGVSLPSPEKWLVIAKVLNLEPGLFQELIDRVWRGRAGALVSDNDAMSGGNYERTDLGEAVTDAARQWDGWGTALKPAMELICVARKPLVGTVAANVLKYGTGALNIDGCRITTGQRPDEDAAWDDDQNLCDLCAERAAQNGKPSTPATRASIAARNAEQTLNGKGETRPAVTNKADIGCSDGTMAAITATSSSIDGSGANDMDLFQQATTSTTSTATSQTIGLKTCNVCRVPLTLQNTASSIRHNRNGLQQPQSDGASLGRWPANTAHDGSDEVVSAFPDAGGGYGKSGGDPAGKGIYGGGFPRGNMQTVGFGDSGSAARFFYSSKADADDRLDSKHPTVKPVDLMRWLVRLITPPGGTVLDPFAGSGTTGMACMAEGFDCILVEREAEYVADIEARIAHVHGDDTPLFRTAAD